MLMVGACGDAYDGPSTFLSSSVEMRAAGAARCGDLEVAVTSDSASSILRVEQERIQINSPHPVKRVGFSPGCDLAFVETYSDPDQREMRVVNLFTNVSGNSLAPDGTIVWQGGGSKFLEAFVSRDDTAWVLVWQDPVSLRWSTGGVALENDYHSRLSASLSALQRRPIDVNLHVDSDGRPTHWLLDLGAGRTARMEF